MKNALRIAAVAVSVIALFLVTGCMQKGVPPDVQKTIDAYVGYWNTGQFDGIENFVDKDFELIESPAYEPKRGIDAFKQSVMQTRTAYPDFKVIVNETVYENGKLGVIWTCSGTNTGPGDRPPTGKVIKGQGVSFIHFKDGKVKDEWLGNNDLLWMKQLGYTFTPPATETVPVTK